NGSMYIPLPTNISNQLSFEFEAYIVFFQKFIEQPTPQIIKGVLRIEILNDSPFGDIDRKNIDGLYWRISILRNRSVHPDKPKYLTKNDEAYQYMGLSSRCLAAEVDGEDIKIKCTLFDLAENKWMNNAI